MRPWKNTRASFCLDQESCNRILAFLLLPEIWPQPTDRARKSFKTTRSQRQYSRIIYDGTRPTAKAKNPPPHFFVNKDIYPATRRQRRRWPTAQLVKTHPDCSHPLRSGLSRGPFCNHSDHHRHSHISLGVPSPVPGAVSDSSYCRWNKGSSEE